MLKNEYVLKVIVNNPSFSINSTYDAIWSVETRINNDDKFIIVDANRIVETDIQLLDLEVMQPDDPTLEGYSGASELTFFAGAAVMLLAFLA